MISKAYKISSVSKAIATTPEAMQLLKDLGSHQQNPWLLKRQTSPNVDKLIDGGIQRMAVSPSRYELHLKMNKEKVGFYKSDELSVRASRTAYIRSNPFEDESYRRCIVRISMDDHFHTQCHPANKQYKKGWVLSFTSWGTYFSPLMLWGTATRDSYSQLKFKFPTMSQAVKYCEALGWGYDIQYQQ